MQNKSGFMKSLVAAAVFTGMVVGAATEYARASIHAPRTAREHDFIVASGEDSYRRFAISEKSGRRIAATEATVPKDTEIRIRVTTVGKGELALFHVVPEGRSKGDIIKGTAPTSYGWENTPFKVWNAGDGNPHPIFDRDKSKVTSGQVLKTKTREVRTAIGEPFKSYAVGVCSGQFGDGNSFHKVTSVERADDGVYKVKTDGGWEFEIKVVQASF